MASAVVPEYLLLLSSFHWPPERENLRWELEAPLASVLREISHEVRKTTAAASLDIAVSVPSLPDHGNMSRSILYDPVQNLVAGIYKLTCVIAARENINVEDNEGIDVRVLILSDRGTDIGGRASLAKTSDQSRIGPLISIQTLAQSGRTWRQLYSIENEQGEKLLRQFLINQDNRVRIRKLNQGSVRSTETTPITAQLSGQKSQDHGSIAVGGTWDHIHIGHKLLLTMFAFLLHTNGSTRTSPQVLTVGITGDELLKNKKYPETLESWQDRQAPVYAFLRAIVDFRPPQQSVVRCSEFSDPGPNGHAVRYEICNRLTINMVEIADPFGPTITDASISALVLSAETRAGGKAVNEKRMQQGWPELDVFEVDVLDATEAKTQNPSGSDAFESKISSTCIRKKIQEKARMRSRT